MSYLAAHSAWLWEWGTDRGPPGVLEGSRGSPAKPVNQLNHCNHSLCLTVRKQQIYKLTAPHCCFFLWSFFFSLPCNIGLFLSLFFIFLIILNILTKIYQYSWRSPEQNIYRLMYRLSVIMMMTSPRESVMTIYGSLWGHTVSTVWKYPGSSSGNHDNLDSLRQVE